jgi:hypothetical protein
MYRQDAGSTSAMSTTASGWKASEDDGRKSTKADDDVLSLRAFCNDDSCAPPALAGGRDRGEAILVSWRSPADPRNPKNWSGRRKWAIVTLSSALAFLSVASSATMAPDLDLVAAALALPADDGAASTRAMLLSAFLLSGAVGPLAFAPLSEMVGRLPVLHASALLFTAFNLACAHARNAAQMLAFRFMAGFGSSATAALASGILADCFDEVGAPEKPERGAI